MSFNYFFCFYHSNFEDVKNLSFVFNSEIKNISEKLSLIHKNQHDVYKAIKFLLVYFVNVSMLFIMC